MTTAELTSRIEAATEKIAKKEAAIIKHERNIEKRVAIITAAGFPESATFNEILAAGGSADARLAALEIEHLKDDIESARDTITATRATIAKYRAAIEKAERESAFVVPAAVEILATELVAVWDEYDKRRREYLRKVYAEDISFAHKEYRRLHNHEDHLRTSRDETIHADNVRAADMMVNDLMRRVYDITGELVDWSNIRAEQGNMVPVLNGYVVGVNGKARVESITAGGWNVQKFHIRTLVHKA